MKKILIFEGRETIGGGQIITKRICDILSSKYDVSVFIPGQDNGISNLLSNYKQYHYQLVPYSSGKKRIKDYFLFFYNAFFTYQMLRKLLKEKHFDLLYIQHQNILPVCVLANWGVRNKIVSHLHVIYIDKQARRMICCFLNHKYVKRIFGVSRYTLSQLSQQNLKKSSILYNPIPLREKIKISCSSHKIAIVGDVVRFKGHHIVFEAMQSLPENSELHVIGNLLDKKYLEQLQSFSIKCVYTGLISDVANYLVENQISLVIIPSISPETFSLSMTESWALGIPTIATDDYGMKEIVEKYISLYCDVILFNKGDVVDLVAKILNLYNDECLYRKVSDAVYCVIREHLNEGKFKKRLLNEISSII